MIYQLFIEGREADINEQISVQLTLAIDDINKYGSRDTSFSKTIVLPGTNANNAIFGNIAELGSSNPYTQGSPNIGVNFNVAQISRAELRLNGLLICKGVFRLTGIVRNKSLVEYEGSIFGELGGFIANIGNKKLEDLDFSEYDHEYNTTNIKDSWDALTTKTFGIATFSTNKTITLRGNFPVFYEGLSITVANTSSNNGTYTITNVSITQNQFLAYTTVLTVAESLVSEIAFSFDLVYSSWGSGYYYPLIDHGTYSTGKVNYDIRTFRPALFVKEYLDKMFAAAGYTYESEFLNTAMFRRLIIPYGKKDLTKLDSVVLNAIAEDRFIEPDTLPPNFEPSLENKTITFDSFDAANWTHSNGEFTYNSAASVILNFNIPYHLVTTLYRGTFKFVVNGNSISEVQFSNPLPQRPDGNGELYEVIGTLTASLTINQNDVVKLVIDGLPFCSGGGGGVNCDTTFYVTTNFKAVSDVPINITINTNDDVVTNDTIPRNIQQKDFFGWILRMFNLYVTDDKFTDKKLLIEPYKDYYDLTSFEDWTYKIAQDKAWQIKPMGMLNGRYFEYKFKEDNDFYNEGYKKKYNQSYGDRLEDTGFQFAKDKQTIEIGFSPTVLVKYETTDKVVPAIYKKSGDTEDRMDSNIRILLAKKITGVTAWDILGGSNPTPLENDLTVYGYAGHFDDPADPTVDINFGAASEIYFSPNSYTSNNLFNVYWSGYIGEIADKDSKLLTCYVYLNELDLANLDFSKPVFIDGVLWRINKVIDYDATNNELTKVELLKIINNG
jgi:hypothetical protein